MNIKILSQRQINSLIDIKIKTAMKDVYKWMRFLERKLIDIEQMKGGIK